MEFVEIAIFVRSVVIAICVPIITVLMFSIWHDIPDVMNQLRSMESSAYQVGRQLSNTAVYLSGIDNSIGMLTEEPTKLSILLLKDAFLSRKDRDEGIMLVEAVEKQLRKKCRKATEHPIS